jgi:hypothetical protein
MADEAVETTETEVTEDAVAPQYVTKEDLDTFQQQLLQVLQRKPEAAVVEKPKLTAEQLAALAASPEKLADFVQSQIASATGKVTQDMRKDKWDAQAYAEFPALKTDKKFVQETTKKIQELVSTGEYDKDNPLLVYRAAQLASLNYKPQQQTAGDGKQVDGKGPRTTEAQGRQSTSKIDDADPRVQWAIAAGVKDLKKFKETLGPREEPKVRAKRVLRA